MENKSEQFICRLCFIYEQEDGEAGRRIYMYNTEDFEELSITKKSSSQFQYLNIGDTITLEGYKCRVKKIGFTLCEMQVMEGGEIYTDSKSAPTDYNGQILVVVERISKA